MKTKINKANVMIAGFFTLTACSGGLAVNGNSSSNSSTPTSSPVVTTQTFKDLMPTSCFRKDNALFDPTNASTYASRDTLVALLSDETASAAQFSNNYDLVPEPAYDHDGRYNDYGGVQKKHYLETIVGRPTVDCGATGTIQARVDDCSAQNGTKAFYDGKKYGQQGEGNWSLVARVTATQNGNSYSYETWRDDRTGLVWSDIHLNRENYASPNGYNWFQAAGYSRSTTTQADLGYESQPNVGTDCYKSDWSSQEACQPTSPISVCANANILNAGSGTRGITNYQNLAYENPSKGGDTLAAALTWRLPTIEDYNQANVNGIRKVLPNMDFAFWSASSFSNGRSDAWIFYGDVGYIRNDVRYVMYGVRCVGR